MLIDDQRSGQPIEVNNDKIKAIITEEEIAGRLNVLPTTIENHLKCVGLVRYLNIWILNELKEICLSPRMSICYIRFKQNKIDHFSKRINTDN